MSEKQETIADIMAEMRERCIDAEHSPELWKYLDRLEAAAKREWEFPKSQSVDADKRTGKDINGVIDDLLKSSKYYYYRGDIVQGQFCRVTADRIREALKRERGNAAAMREAVEKCVDLILSFGNAELDETPLEVIIDIEAILKAALSAPSSEHIEEAKKPLRNCDRFNAAADAIDAFQDKSDNSLVYSEAWNEFICWLFARAEKQEGGVK